MPTKLVKTANSEGWIVNTTGSLFGAITLPGVVRKAGFDPEYIANHLLGQSITAEPLPFFLFPVFFYERNTLALSLRTGGFKAQRVHT